MGLGYARRKEKRTMTANSQIPNGGAAGEAPVWSPAPDLVADAPEATGAVPDIEAAPATRPALDLGPGFSGKKRAKAKSGKAGSTTMLLMIGALVAVGGVGFALGHNLGGGSSTGDNAAGGNAPNGSFSPGQFGPNASGALERAGGLGGGTVTGTVESVTSDSMTVKLANGQTVTIALGSSTTYHSQTSASSSTVTSGSTVIVQTSDDGTAAGASASPGAGNPDSGTRTATDVTVTSN